jgi:hypothetical protein
MYTVMAIRPAPIIIKTALVSQTLNVLFDDTFSLILSITCNRNKKVSGAIVARWTASASRRSTRPPVRR